MMLSKESINLKRCPISLATRETREMQIKTTPTKTTKTRMKHCQEWGATELLDSANWYNDFMGEEKNRQYLLKQDLCLPITISEIY